MASFRIIGIIKQLNRHCLGKYACSWATAILITPAMVFFNCIMTPSENILYYNRIPTLLFLILITFMADLFQTYSLNYEIMEYLFVFVHIKHGKLMFSSRLLMILFMYYSIFIWSTCMLKLEVGIFLAFIGIILYKQLVEETIAKANVRN